MDQSLKPIIIILGVFAIGFLSGAWLFSDRGNQNIPEGIQQEQSIGTENQATTTASTPNSLLPFCFRDHTFARKDTMAEKSIEGVGFKMQAPSGITITDLSTTLLRRSFTIQDTQHEVSVKAFYLRDGDNVRLSSLYDPTVVFEPNSNTWWKEKWLDTPKTQCEPNPAAITTAGDAVYVTGAGDAGSYYRDYTVIFSERLQNPVSGYPEAIQVRVGGDVNDVDYASFKIFEEIIEQMMLTAEPVVNRG